MSDLNKENIDEIQEKNEDVTETAENADKNREQENAQESENGSEPDETSADQTEAIDEKKSGSHTILIVEIVIALIAIGFIIFALVSNNKSNDSVSGNDAASGNVVSQNQGNAASNTGTAPIDNSALYENPPALPDISELNVMEQADAEAALTDGSMLKFTTADGTEIYVGNYTDQAAYTEAVMPTEEEIDDAIFQDILYYKGENTENDHTVVEEWDVVSANYVGKLDGTAFEGGSAENVSITVGAGGYIPGFEEGLLGMSIGETKDVPVTFPENYENIDLAGKEVIFTFTVNDITGSMTFPELTDEIVQEAFYNYDDSVTTVEECRDYYKTRMLQDNVWDFILGNYYIASVSEDAVRSYYNDMMEYYDQMSVYQYSMSVSDMLAYSGATLDDLKQDTITNACYTAIQFSICNAIATENNITVSDEDIAELAAEYGYADSESFIADNGEDTVHEYLIQENVLDYLVTLVSE